ncbi:hypothetical protein SeMB42_g00748 [Synchytrium endobioticum]|uniref:G-patch domain-containing protein n=1 Tax=Synchytrium endobioticum TaxID=286115 RepID=A0A507CG12_9FUNG|nr:hypothetical protein SeLEV6574_g07975 [Synchytrium endobioticum]TPX53486.1 hypothetical protein SeMB42_g00748 [Synchytrium endobioticum]
MTIPNQQGYIPISTFDIDGQFIIDTTPTPNWEEELIDVDDETYSASESSAIIVYTKAHQPNTPKTRTGRRNYVLPVLKPRRQRHQAPKRFRSNQPPSIRNRDDEAAFNDYIQNIQLYGAESQPSCIPTRDATIDHPTIMGSPMPRHAGEAAEQVGVDKHDNRRKNIYIDLTKSEEPSDNDESPSGVRPPTLMRLDAAVAHLPPELSDVYDPDSIYLPEDEWVRKPPQKNYVVDTTEPYGRAKPCIYTNAMGALKASDEKLQEFYLPEDEWLKTQAPESDQITCATDPRAPAIPCVSTDLMGALKVGNAKLKEFAELAKASLVTECTWPAGPDRLRYLVMDMSREYGIHCTLSRVGNSQKKVIKMKATPNTRVPAAWKEVPSKFATVKQRFKGSQEREARPENNTIVFESAPPLSEDNKGFKLLKSMGWAGFGRAKSEGDTEGRGDTRLHLNEARLIDVVFKCGRAGLGCEG